MELKFTNESGGQCRIYIENNYTAVFASWAPGGTTSVPVVPQGALFSKTGGRTEIRSKFSSPKIYFNTLFFELITRALFWNRYD